MEFTLSKAEGQYCSVGMRSLSRFTISLLLNPTGSFGMTVMKGEKGFKWQCLNLIFTGKTERR